MSGIQLQLLITLLLIFILTVICTSKPLFILKVTTAFHEPQMNGFRRRSRTLSHREEPRGNVLDQLASGSGQPRSGFVWDMLLVCCLSYTVPWKEACQSPHKCPSSTLWAGHGSLPLQRAT